jgi:hypothetical protein
MPMWDRTQGSGYTVAVHFISSCLCVCCQLTVAACWLQVLLSALGTPQGSLGLMGGMRWYIMAEVKRTSWTLPQHTAHCSSLHRPLL